MKFFEFKNFLYRLYPTETSFTWDTDGVEVCFDENCKTKSVLICLDITADIADYAIKNKYDCIISHHPLIFSPVKKLTADTSEMKTAMTLLRNDITAISFHTRLDSAKGGVNDILIKALDLNGRVSNFGNVENGAIGRIIELEKEIDIKEFAEVCSTNLKNYLEQYSFNGKIPVQYVKGDRNVKKIALVGGGGIMFFNDAVSCGADTFLCGDAGYNKIVSAYDVGEYAKTRLNFLFLNHFETECVVLPELERIIKAEFAEIRTEVYKDNRIKTL